MNRTKSIVAIVVVVAVLAVAALALGLGGNKSDDSTETSDTSMSGMDMSQSDTNNSSNDTNQTSTETAATDSVTIRDYAFSPATITVKVGTTVTWTNQDSVRHDVVSDDGSADGPSGPLLAKGETYKFTFNKAGTYSYHCSPHPYMKAKVVVTE